MVNGGVYSFNFHPSSHMVQSILATVSFARSGILDVIRRQNRFFFVKASRTQFSSVDFLDSSISSQSRFIRMRSVQMELICLFYFLCDV